ncbi:hypothetical protein JA1_001980 [Spathaspora sp. JA1]|nr:hypothetical protein JA1_001980 [Spathaspora sp. JA1]
MRQFLILCYILVILTTVNADDDPTLTWSPSFTYETEECPTEWKDKCDYGLGARAQEHGYPDVITFEYKRISHLIGSDDLYEVLLEFEIDDSHQFPSSMFAKEISFNNLQTPDNYLGDHKVALDQDLYEIRGSHHHFFVKWVMQAEAHGQSMCTTPFMIEYTWIPLVVNKAKRAEVKAQYIHDCDDGDYSLQCWIPVCSGSETDSNHKGTSIESTITKNSNESLPRPNTTESAKATTQPQETTQPEVELVESEEELVEPEEDTQPEKPTSESENESTHEPKPVTVDPERPDFSESTNCPEVWIENGGACNVNIGEHAHSVGNPEVLAFEFQSIRFVQENLYDVVVEFQIDSRAHPIGDLVYVEIQVSDSAYNYLGRRIRIFDGNSPSSPVGDSPFHFYFAFVIASQPIDALTCTTPFTITYIWKAHTASYAHACSVAADSPLQCWEELCVEQPIEAEPSTIISTRDDLPSPIACPMEYGPSGCQVNHGARDVEIPEVLKFDFISIEWVEDDSYEIMIEFKIDTSMEIDELRSVYISRLWTPGNYLTEEVLLYDRRNIDNAVGDSPYHFFFKWVGTTQFLTGSYCTTPFTIMYQWGHRMSAEYGHGCAPEINIVDSPLQCWQEVCDPEASGEPSTIINTDPDISTTELEESTIEPENETTSEPQPVTIDPSRPELPEPLNCPEVWTDDSLCQINIGENAHNEGYPEVLAFEFQSIRIIQENLYEVIVEFQIDSQARPISDLRGVQISVEQPAYGYIRSRFRIYDSRLSKNLVGELPFHFYLAFVMGAQQIDSLTCTTPFTIDYIWQDSSASYAHDCSGDSPPQCWQEVCYREAPEAPSTIISTESDASEPEPLTVDPPRPQLPEPLNCPEVWTDDSRWQGNFGEHAHNEGYPEILAFEFQSIRFIQDNIYDVIVEFQIDSQARPISDLREVQISVEQPAYGYIRSRFIVYNGDPQGSPVGDSPFHFYFAFIMETSQRDSLTCTTLFSITYIWQDSSASYVHTSSDNGDFPFQCWQEVCDPEAPREPSTITGPEQEPTTHLVEPTTELEVSTTVSEESTNQKEDETTSDPEPVTIDPPRPQLPEPLNCPEVWTDHSLCQFNIGENAHNEGYPEVLAFEFQSIRFIQENLYEVIVEFHIDSKTHPIRDLASVMISVSASAYNYLSRRYWIYDGNAPSNPVGESPFHFYFAFVMGAQQMDSLTCTTPFTIDYLWQDFSASYAHTCSGVADSPLQCWEELCDEQPIEAEPSTIISTRDDLPSPIACPIEYGPSGCQVGNNARFGSPEVLKFDFISIEWVEDDSYEIMIEFEIDDTIPKDQLQMIFIWQLRTPGNYLPSEFQLYNRWNIDNAVGDSPYHFFFKWIGTTQFLTGSYCTTPFTIMYQWDYGMSADYGHGCPPEMEVIYSPLQCWQEVCDPEASGEPSTIIATEPDVPTTELEESTTKSENESTHEPKPVTVDPERPDFPESTNCPEVWSENGGACNINIGQHAHSVGNPEVLAFEFQSIRFVQENLYDVVVEFQIDSKVHPIGDLLAVEIRSSEWTYSYLGRRGIKIYDVNAPSNPVGDSPFHFYFAFVMESQPIDALTCTTPFTITYFWKDYTASYAHTCSDSGDFPLQCWEELCVEQPIEAEPSTIISTRDDLPSPIACPIEYGPSGCSVNSVTRPVGIPEVLKFEFISIEWVEDDSYEIMIEFEIDARMDIELLQDIHIWQLRTPGDYLPEEVLLYDRSNIDNAVGDSPYHFFFKWVGTAQFLTGSYCTNSFTIWYQWDYDMSAVYGHGCPPKINIVDSPLQCWQEVCDPEASGGPSTIITTGPEQEPTTHLVGPTTELEVSTTVSEESTSELEESATELEESTTQTENDNTSVPEPVTIDPPRPQLPEPLNCPEVWTDDSICQVNFGENAHNEGYPEVLAFEFQSIRFVDEGLYEVAIEFQIDSRARPQKDLELVRMQIDDSADGYLTRFNIYEAGSPSNLAGDSPFHFYFVFVMRAQRLGSLTCTSPIWISYYWKDNLSAYYSHNCWGFADSPLQCWQEICPPGTTEEPSTITAEPDVPTTGPEPEPTTEPDVPTTESEGSTGKQDKPTTEQDEPTIQPEEPTTEPEVSTAQPEDQTTASEEMTTSPEKPTTLPEEHTTSSEEAEESTTKHEEPSDPQTEPHEEPTTIPEDPTSPPTHEESIVTTVESPPPATRTLTESVVTDVDNSSTGVLTETKTYTTIDSPEETNTLTETIIRTDVDHSTTRIFTETVINTIVDPPPDTRTFTNTVTTVVVDPGNPNNSITLTLTEITTGVNPPNPTGGSPNPPSPATPVTVMTVTISNPDTTYVTTVTGPNNPPVVVTTISNSDTTYVTTITEPYNTPVVVTVSGSDTTYVTTVTQPYNPPVIVTTISNSDTAYVTTITDPYNPPVVVTVSGGLPSVTTGPQPGVTNYPNVASRPGDPIVPVNPNSPNSPSNPNVPNGSSAPNVPAGNPDQEEDLQVSYSGGNPNSPGNPSVPNGSNNPNDPNAVNPNDPSGDPDQDEQLQVPYSGSIPNGSANPNGSNGLANPNGPNAGNPNDPATSPNQDEELQVPASPANPNDSASNPDQEQLQVPVSGGNSNDGIANPNIDSGNPNDPSLNPEGDELVQNPNVLVYTSSITTTFVSDGITYTTSVPVVYTTTVPDGVPDVMVAPGVGNSDDDLGADPNLEEMLEGFEGGASGLSFNACMLVLCLISTILFV